MKDDQSRERKRPADPQGGDIQHASAVARGGGEEAGERSPRTAQVLRKLLENRDARVRAAALTALVDTESNPSDLPDTRLAKVADKDPDMGTA